MQYKDLAVADQIKRGRIMVYKDKAKQREANRKASQRRRDMLKGMANQGVMDAGVMVIDEQPNVTPGLDIREGFDEAKIQRVTDQEFTRRMATAGPGHVRVSKPGDADYEPQCETTKAFVGKDHSMGCDPVTLVAFHKGKPKRGLDIKCFEDLPPDVQLGIKSMSMDETGYVDEDEKAKRTAAAIRYQHLFPGRY